MARQDLSSRRGDRDLLPLHGDGVILVILLPPDLDGDGGAHIAPEQLGGVDRGHLGGVLGVDLDENVAALQAGHARRRPGQDGFDHQVLIIVHVELHPDAPEGALDLDVQLPVVILVQVDRVRVVEGVHHPLDGALHQCRCRRRSQRLRSDQEVGLDQVVHPRCARPKEKAAQSGRDTGNDHSHKQWFYPTPFQGTHLHSLKGNSSCLLSFPLYEISYQIIINHKGLATQEVQNRVGVLSSIGRTARSGHPGMDASGEQHDCTQSQKPGHSNNIER